MLFTFSLCFLVILVPERIRCSSRVSDWTDNVVAHLQILARKQHCTCPLVPTRSPYCSRIATWRPHPMGRSPVACCIRSKMAPWSFSARSRWSTGLSGRIFRSKLGNIGCGCSGSHGYARDVHADALNLGISGRYPDEEEQRPQIQQDGTQAPATNQRARISSTSRPAGKTCCSTPSAMSCLRRSTLG